MVQGIQEQIESNLNEVQIDRINVAVNILENVGIVLYNEVDKLRNVVVDDVVGYNDIDNGHEETESIVIFGVQVLIDISNKRKVERVELFVDRKLNKEVEEEDVVNIKNIVVLHFRKVPVVQGNNNIVHQKENLVDEIEDKDLV